MTKTFTDFKFEHLIELNADQLKDIEPLQRRIDGLRGVVEDAKEKVDKARKNLQKAIEDKKKLLDKIRSES